MNAYYMSGFLLAVFAICLTSAAPSNSAAVKHVVEKSPTQDEVLFLAKILAPLRQLRREADNMESWVETAVKSKNIDLPELAKRQAAYDMDYGWGGGRFGKRAEGGEKRYDMDYGWGGGRFGKRAEGGEKRYDMDYGWGGGRFGKRADDGSKRYDLYSVGGRFGRSAGKTKSKAN